MASAVLMNTVYLCVFLAFGLSAGAATHAETYLRVSLFGLTSMLLMLAGMGVLRGLQDTRTPPVVAGTAALLNVALSISLVFGLDSA